ncbi:MAG: papain-like cysteine protease family protein [Planctomycetota bacterium]
MSVYLNVVYVNQLNYGGGMTDPTGCWYCSAEMIGKTFEEGPRRGVPEIHGANGHAATGTKEASDRRFEVYKRSALTLRGGQMKAFHNTDNEHQLLAKRENLRPVEDHAGVWTLLELDKLLRDSGPIFFYWNKRPKGGGPGSEYGHASVLVGTDDASGRVCYHDPEDGRNQTMPVDDFNAVRQDFKWAMMRRNGVTGGALVAAPPGTLNPAAQVG